MIYNYARFGSVFDFGIQYSLTINDFTAAQYHTHFVLIGFLIICLRYRRLFRYFRSLTVQVLKRSFRRDIILLRRRLPWGLSGRRFPFCPTVME